MLNIVMQCHYAECHYAGTMLGVTMLSVTMLSVTMLSVTARQYDTQHKLLSITTTKIKKLSKMTLDSECCDAEYRVQYCSTECHYAKCRYAECRGAFRFALNLTKLRSYLSLL
jgi:hypothetical protein